DPADRVGPQVRVAEQPGEPDRPGPAEPFQRIRVGAGQVQRSGPAVLVVEEGVAPAQVGQRGNPPRLRRRDQLGAPARFLLAAPPPRPSGLPVLLPPRPAPPPPRRVPPRRPALPPRSPSVPRVGGCPVSTAIAPSPRPGQSPYHTCPFWPNYSARPTVPRIAV